MDLRETVRNMYREGYGVRQIANKLGMDYAVILRIVHRL
jgi:transposase-like protein